MDEMSPKIRFYWDMERTLFRYDIKDTDLGEHFLSMSVPIGYSLGVFRHVRRRN